MVALPSVLSRQDEVSTCPASTAIFDAPRVQLSPALGSAARARDSVCQPGVPQNFVRHRWNFVVRCSGQPLSHIETESTSTCPTLDVIVLRGIENDPQGKGFWAGQSYRNH